ncbi:hypothetical protein BT96DRAFT_995965 [Gymnopus androsaceus JB14]|uniref:Uncharacterized protein n=1 Tax=Gymnopus androsaceus JB14 TaxID=1447944 RepID=A0A6A4HGY0_9AGAR|nr:hypothetical protein BT96DRAFT_995965 [Gymnopus androsaceus JB14]
MSSMRSGSKFDEYELPSGIKQIGSGIGFTYTVPAASGSKSSICIPGGAPKRSHSKLPVLGLGLGLRTLSGGILRSKSRREGHGQAGPEYSRPSQDLHMKMNSVPEDIAGEMEAEEQDIFRYGSTWSLMPGDACCRIRVPGF